jgi:hypothetical protein
MKQLASNQTKEQCHQSDDPVVKMLGVGKQLWTNEPGDKFIDRLRSEELPPPIRQNRLDVPLEDASESVWHRIQSHQGEEFKTATGLPFTYDVEGAGIWFFRNGQRINRKLTRNQLNLAVARCPLRSTTEIKDLMDYAYLFAVLMDRRIRGEAW